MADTMMSRRAFFGMTAGGALALYLPTAVGYRQAFAAPIPGGSLSPRKISQFRAPLVVPPAMPTIAPGEYEVAVRQMVQQILPPGLPATPVWGYGSAAHPGTFHYPAFTIEARRGTPTTVTWVNDLTDDSGHFLPHLLPVDPTLHWANPPGGVAGRDSRPTFTSTPGPYRGPVPVSVHVHGMEHVPDWSDGYAEAWFLPDAVDIPSGHATVGTWHDFFAAKAATAGLTWSAGRVVSRYPNTQVPSTLWYHDHVLGMTRLNVYAGPAGFWLLRSDDPADNPTVAGGAPAVLPGPAPQVGEAAGTRHHEIPLAIQDRSFHEDGALFYPDSREFFDGYSGPYVPDTEVPPIWNPEFFGNCMVVNGRTWPFLDVEPRRYRFRVLNGCNARFLVLRVDDPRVSVWKIGNEAGYLPAALSVRDILLAPAERADLVIDFSRMPMASTATLLNRGPDSPFGGGGFRPADPRTTGRVLQFRVVLPVPAGFVDPSTPPEQLVMPPVTPVAAAVRTRSLALVEEVPDPPGPDIPIAAKLGTFDPSAGLPSGVDALEWREPVTENPSVGDSELWEIFNFTEDAHPIHIHEVLFQVLDRQGLDRKTGKPLKRPTPPPPEEQGLKDTVIAYPGQVTRVRMVFGQAGQFVWHCHIVEHEDNEMMRPYRIGPPQPGQPS